MSLTQRQSAYKMTFDGILLYMRVQAINYEEVKSHLNAGRSVDLVVEFVSTGSNLK